MTNKDRLMKALFALNWFVSFYFDLAIPVYPTETVQSIVFWDEDMCERIVKNILAYREHKDAARSNDKTTNPWCYYTRYLREGDCTLCPLYSITNADCIRKDYKRIRQQANKIGKSFDTLNSIDFLLEKLFTELSK